MLKKRVIPVLLLQNGGLVKTVRFKNPVYIGDPINAVRIFNEKEVDELVILDIEASRVHREPDFELLGKLAGEAFMPLAYGGGVDTRNQVRQLLRLGFEKIIINTAFYFQEKLLSQLADEFGSSSIVAGIDVKKNLLGKNEIYARCGTDKQPGQLLDICLQREKQGAGELLLHSIDRDGTMKGYDIEVIQDIASRLSIPVIACGGAGQLVHIVQAHQQTNAAAFAAGSMFIFHGPHKAVLISYPDYEQLQQALKDK